MPSWNMFSKLGADIDFTEIQAGSLSTTGGTAVAGSTDTPTASSGNKIADINHTHVLASGAVKNADVHANALISYSKLGALTATYMLVGNASNVATSVAISGDVTMSNAGAVAVNSLASGAVAVDHETASTDMIVNVCYGTGSAPTACDTTEGSIYITYTA